MLLTIHNLPAATRYADIKSLLQSKCGIQQVILDNLVSEGSTKKVTVGVAEDADAAIVTRKINGLFWNGQQLYVEDIRQQKAPSDQPYRSTNPQSQPQVELPYTMNLAQNSSYDMMSAQQMMAPMYYMPVPAYPNVEAYGPNAMDALQDFRQEKVQSAYPGISGFAQNASAAPQYGESQFDSQQDYEQPPKRSRWSDEVQDSTNETALYGRRYDQNRDWQANRALSPRREPRDSRKPVWQVENDGPVQPDYRANVRPTQSDYRSNTGPIEPDFRPNIRPTESEFRSTVRPEKRSDFVRPGLLDKPSGDLGFNVQRRENEREEGSNERETFSRRPNENIFSRRPNDEFSRRPNDEFSRRPNDEFSRRTNDEFSRRSNEQYSRRPNERAEFSRRPNLPDRSNERQGTNRFSGRPAESSRRPNDREEHSRRPNDRAEFSRRPNERAEFSRRPNGPSRSNERQGTNRFSGRPNELPERQGKPSRFNEPSINRSDSGFDRNERSERRPIPDSRKRKFEEPRSWQQTSAPPRPSREQFSSAIAAPPLTEQAKEKLNKRMRTAGINKILHDLYISLNLTDLNSITKRTLRKLVTERVDGLIGEKKMVTSMEIFEIYRAKYPNSVDKATYEVVVEEISQIVAVKKNEGNQEVKPVKPAVQPPVTAAPAAQMAAPTRPPPPKPPTKGERREVKPVKPAVQPPVIAAPAAQMAAPTRPPPPKPPTKAERRAMKNLKDAKQLLSQGKLPKFPLGDKSKVAQQRKEEKHGIIPETEPITTAALTDEVDSLLQICTDELVNPPDETTRQIYKSVCPEEFIADVKTIITQNLARRVTDSGLKVVRVYGRPKLPKREVLEKFLIKFGVQSLRKSDKVKMFTAACDTYENFDKLCNATFNTPDGISVHFKPFHAAPKQRADQTLLKKIRKRNLKQMIERSELNLLDKDWPAKEEEIKAKEAEKQAKLAAETAAYEEQKALEDSQADKTENEANGDENTENAQAYLTNTTINEDDSEVDQTNTTLDESNDYFNDDFHVIDEVNETDSDLECLGDTDKQVFYLDEDLEIGFTNDESVNNGNENTVENAIGDTANDNNDVENDTNIVAQNDENIEDQNNEIFENNDLENNDAENNTNNDDNENEENLLDGDDDFEMGDAEIDNLDVDLDEIDDGDLEDY